MAHQSYNNKRIVWESKAKQFLTIIVCSLFVAIAIWINKDYSSILFWGSLFLFGGMGIFILLRVLNPKNLFVTRNSKLGKQIMAEQIKQAQEDLGHFSYNDKGFSMTYRKGIVNHNWQDIETIFAYKEDRITSDEICLDLFTHEKTRISLTESTRGWYQFNKRLREQFPSISKTWEWQIATPAFERNLTLLFDMKGRTKDEAVIVWYAK